MSNFTHELILIDEADVSGFRSNQANPLRVHGQFVNFRKNGRSWQSCEASTSTRWRRTRWLGWEDSNLCISESTFAKTLSLGSGTRTSASGNQCFAENDIGVSLGPLRKLGHTLEASLFIHSRRLEVIARYPDPQNARSAASAMKAFNNSRA